MIHKIIKSKTWHLCLLIYKNQKNWKDHQLWLMMLSSHLLWIVWIIGHLFLKLSKASNTTTTHNTNLRVTGEWLNSYKMRAGKIVIRILGKVIISKIRNLMSVVRTPLSRIGSKWCTFLLGWYISILVSTALNHQIKLILQKLMVNL